MNIFTSKGCFLGVQMRHCSNFLSLNLFFEQALLLPWQLSYFKVREMCVNKAIISYISFVRFAASEEEN